MTLFPTFSTGVPLAITTAGCVLKPQIKTFPESGVLLQGLQSHGCDGQGRGLVVPS